MEAEQIRKKKNVKVKKENASKLIDELIERVKTVNESEDKYKFPFKVKNLILFGSYLTDKERLGDIDIIYYLECNWADREKMQEHFLKIATGRDFIEKLFYPERLVVQFLRNKHKSFSFHDKSTFDSLVELNKEKGTDFNYKFLCKDFKTVIE